MRSGLALIIAVGLVVSGCAPIDQLKTMKASATGGDYASNAAVPVSCTPEQAGCAQTRSIKADGCHRLLAADVPAARRLHLDCAVENYTAALTALDRIPDPEVDRAQLELGLLDSLQRRRDIATGSAEAELDNQVLLEQAGRVKGAAASYYGADATLNAVLRKGPVGGCAEISRAAQTLRNGGAEGTAFSTLRTRLGQAIANARSARGCAA